MFGMGRVNLFQSPWLAEDDPNEVSTLRICGTSLIIPVSFDDHCVLIAFERELDRRESKFRAGRKDKSIGGELGSIIIKKRPSKQLRKLSSSTSKYPYHHSNVHLHHENPSYDACWNYGQPSNGSISSNHTNSNNNQYNNIGGNDFFKQMRIRP